MPASIHPHGVFYTKSSEGAPYNDGTAGSDKADDAVQPGHTYTYTWQVPDRAGPGPMDGSSVLWMYHSHTNEIADTNAGLVGPMVITRRGSARADGSPVDVDREVFSFFSVLNENESPADLLPDGVGTWLFHCHVNEHIAAGMITRYKVTG
jgi:manganese oxidase